MLFNSKPQMVPEVLLQAASPTDIHRVTLYNTFLRQHKIQAEESNVNKPGSSTISRTEEWLMLRNTA